jgi:hypothetical protein
MAKAPDPEADSFDVALVGGATSDGDGRHVLRLRPDGASIGEVRPLKEGRPIHGEVVQLKPREGAPWLCDVDVALPAQHPVKAAEPAADPELAERHGPARSDERRVGKECRRLCRSRWSPYH